ncbi:MAG: DegV family protein [Defluviitaleaceae bacterium]|nr:DegV family protein [Defluviitaleaceae bacterium]MCL2240501.1 DegV family protein [Defluviitaleaceae bacterium]
MFKIISDAGCDFTVAQATEFGVETVPFYIINENGVQKTSQPNPQDYMDKFTPYLKAGMDILAITISSKLSGSFNSASLAADMLKEDFPDRSILLVDSLSASIGQGLITREMVKMRDAGFSIQETAARANKIVQSTRVYVTVENLESLKRGGRIGPTTAFVGGILGLRPILHVVDGQVVQLDTVRGKKNALRMIGEAMVHTLKDEVQNVHICIGHVESQPDAEAFIAKLESDLQITLDTPLTEVGTAISTHTGPGAMAFAYCKKYTAFDAVALKEAA